MALMQTSLSSLGNAVRSARHRQIGDNRNAHRRHVPHTPAALNVESAASSAAVSPEWALIRQAIAGNSDSQNALFAAYSSRLYRTAFAVLRNREDAEDALQDGLCNAHIHLRSFQGRSSFVTWLTRIVVNSALMIRRKQNSRVALSLHEIMENEEGRQGREFADDGPNPEEIYCVAEIDGLLAAEVGKLPAKLQTAFQLSEVDGFSIAESSQRLGVGKCAFKSRLMRARRRLTHELNRSLHARESRSLSL